MTELKRRTPELAEIGAMKMYCDKVKVTAAANVTDTGTVTGYSVITNHFRRVTRMTFTGKVYVQNRPFSYIGFTGNMLGSTNIDIRYRGMIFSGCIISGFTIEDSNEEYITMTVNAATLNAVGVSES